MANRPSKDSIEVFILLILVQTAVQLVCGRVEVKMNKEGNISLPANHGVKHYITGEKSV